MKHNLKALRDLEKRLAEAKDRDLGLDGDILEVVDLASGVIAPPYTTSLDAAVALVERVLPDRDYTVRSRRKHPDQGAHAHEAVIWGPTGLLEYHLAANGFSSAPAFALCLACVRALIAQGEVKP